ncbi:hypothetical protein NQ315_014706, partial [Exocentrus adspersus]
MYEHGYLSTINSPTRVHLDSESCLDHIFLKTKIPVKNFLPIVLQTIVTDHFSTIIQCSVSTENEEKVASQPKYKVFINYDRLKIFLKVEKWESVYKSGNVVLGTDKFMDILVENINKCTEFKRIKRREIKRSKWITSGLIKSVNKKNDLYNLVKINPVAIKSIEVDNNIITDKKIIANNFIEYFSEVDKNLARDIKNSGSEINNNQHSVNSIFLTPTTEEEIRKFILELKIDLSYPQNLPKYDKISIKCDLDTIEIRSVDSIKYLGVTIDRHLRWDIHLNNVTKKLRYLLPLFKNMKMMCDIEQLRILYFGLVQCHLNYGRLSWGGVTNNYLKQLEIVQKRIIKIMYGIPQLTSSEELYKNTKLFDLRQLFCLAILIDQYKNKTSKANINHKYNTRRKEHGLQELRAKKTIGQRNYMHLTARI